MNLPNWPPIRGFRDIQLGLDRVLKLLERLDNPHQKLPPVIHVAGTNGKGSTLSYLEAILEDAGYKTHKYTSPHLVEFNERIVLRGKQISDVYLSRIILECKIVANIKPEIEVTFFEGITVAAFLAFSRIKADVLLLETGMGGRLDATNVVADPLLTIITSISMDHTDFLGDNLAKIAAEKAGIIKKNAPVITSNRDESVLDAICQKAASINNAQVFHLGKHFDVQINENDVDFISGHESMKLDFPALSGKHQIENASLAIAALQLQNHFKISAQNIRNGLKNAKWRGRIEKITEGKIRKLLPQNYDLYIDGGHNSGCARVLSDWIAQENTIYLAKNVNSAKNPPQKPYSYLICAMLSNKDAQGFFSNLSSVADFVIGIPLQNYSEGFTGAQIAKFAAQNGIKSTFANNFAEALKLVNQIHLNNSVKKDLAKSGILKDGKFSKIKNFLQKLLKKESKIPARVIVCGSLYLVGDFLKEN